jgi:uncharacterized protein with LGFP repeats
MRRHLATNKNGLLIFAALTFCALATAAHPADAGVFADKYAKLGGSNGPLGVPTSAIYKCKDGVGLYQNFTRGALYYHPSFGDAYAVYGGIYQKWVSLGAEGGFLGYPYIDETGSSDGVGRFNHFQNGSIYWTPSTGAHEIHGAIRQRWAEMGAEKAFGYPVTDETKTPDGVGRYNHFSAGGSIYWTPNTGAHEVYGAIRVKWASMGWEKSFLGYPLTGEQDVAGGGRINYFQGGTIYWTPQGGAVAYRR